MDGALLIYDYGKTNTFKGLGYVEFPEFSTGDHPVTEHIEEPEFRAYVTRVYENSDEIHPIYTTDFGIAAFSTRINGNDAVVFGYDLHQSDLPLSVEFPIMMIFRYSIYFYERSLYGRKKVFKQYNFHTYIS